MSKNIVIWSKGALKQLLKIDSRYIKTVKNKVNELADFPDVLLDIKDLKGKDHKNQYRLRVGNYRVIFEVINSTPKIIEIQTIKKRDERTYN